MTKSQSLAVCLTVAGASAFLTAPRADAAVLFYNTFKVESFNQTSSAQPATAAGFSGFANVNASLATDLSGGEVISLSPLSPMGLTGSNGNYAFGMGFGTKPALDAGFPNGATYTFLLTGGTFNGQTASLTAPATDDYSATVPYFTGSTYLTLQNFNTANAINLLFNAWAAPGGVNTPLTFVGINRVSDGSTAYATSGPNTLTSALVGANTLLPSTQYDLDIVYSARLSTANAGFGSATSFSAYDLRTDLLFTTAPAATATPEPASVFLMGFGALVVISISRKSAARAPRR